MHICPHCQSHRIITRNLAKTTGGIIGTIGGSLSGAASALSGAEVGGTIGLVAGPIGSALCSVAGAIIGGMFGATAGGITGAKLGEVVDQRVLDNYACLDCGHTFSFDGVIYQ